MDTGNVEVILQHGAEFQGAEGLLDVASHQRFEIAREGCPICPLGGDS